MEDHAIIELYFARDESAIKETDAKYGAYCTAIAYNLLNVREDAQECVNDTYLAVWERIPPHIPECLRAFLGRMTRNIAVDRYRRTHAKKRSDGLEVTLSELGECLPSDENVERALDAKLLAESLNAWLLSLPEQDRMLFVRRYFYGDAAKGLAKKTGMSEAGLSRRLAKLRDSLRAYLTERGNEL